MTNGHDFSRILRLHRHRTGQTQQQLADLSAMSVRAIRDLERGRVRRPRRETVRLIADGLGLSGRSRADFLSASGHGTATRDLKTMYDAAPSAPPAPLDTLVGRGPEVALLRDLFASGTQRLVTVTGLRGVGKTRVALDVAFELHRSRGFPVLWLPAWDGSGPHRGVGGVDRLPRSVRSGFDAFLTTSDDTALDQLVDLIGDRPTLLVVDGHPASGLRSDRLLTLLERCSGLRALLTSHTPFEFCFERSLVLAPLAVPERGGGDPARLAGVASVELFTRYVRQLQPDFALTARNGGAVAELCRRLDGMPVALSAAAPWLLVYGPRVLLEHVRADPFHFGDRARTDDGLVVLRQMLLRTIHSLDAAERAVLAGVIGAEADWSVQDAAERASLPDGACAGAIRRMLARGLLRSTSGDRSRFRVLELVRHLHAAGGSAAERALEGARPAPGQSRGRLLVGASTATGVARRRRRSALGVARAAATPDAAPP